MLYPSFDSTENVILQSFYETRVVYLVRKGWQEVVGYL